MHTHFVELSVAFLVVYVGRVASADSYNGTMSAAPSVTISSGVLLGTAVSPLAATAPINKFLGVPYAAPPERFCPPREPLVWSKPLNVTAFKPACIQQFNYPEPTRSQTIALFNNPPPEESEDCLYLNIWAPSSSPSDNGRAVMVWIHGGGLIFGGTSNPFYEGSNLAAVQDVVVVSIAYRTNVFGFPSAPELPLASSNLGFLDQRFALAWVQKNIAAFGGDPAKVTIFGESSGASSVDRLVTALPMSPPFRAAITQSGQASTSSANAPNGTVAWEGLVAGLNCTGNASALACVRAAPTLTIKSVIEHAALHFAPVTDNITQIADPKGARAQGNIAKVPILTGSNAQDGTAFALGATNFSTYLDTLFPGQSALQTQITDAYTLGTNGVNTVPGILSLFLTELQFQCPTAVTANATAAIGLPTWRYLFNASFPNFQPVPGIGAFHGSEIPLIFGTYPRQNATQQQINLSLDMQTAWAGFAKDPHQGPGWDQIGKSDNDVAVLGYDGSSGAEVLDQAILDARCGTFADIYAKVTSPLF